MIVFYYINNTINRFGTFVANRLAKIHDLTQASQWRDVKSTNNPADKTSRGMLSFHCKEDWLNGPEFLRAQIDIRSVEPIPECSPDQLELKKKEIVINIIEGNEMWRKLWERFSDWLCLLKTVIWLSRYKSYLMIFFGHRNSGSLQLGNLKLSEYRRAELNIIKLVQAEAFPKDVASLSEISASSTILKNSSLRRLRPMLVDGILRVDGRLNNMQASFDIRHPIILPRRHVITRLIVRHLHLCEGHVGAAHLLAKVREKYWIPHGAAVVKEVLSACMVCRRKNATIGQQLMAPLPVERVNPSWHAFAETGVDYFGPFNVRQGRSLVKRYGCIFSCLQTRAVHLEVAHSLDTQAFLMCLTRFIARRGSPENLYSDNGTNFVGADRELKMLLRSFDQRRIERSLAPRSIQWHFIPPYASHRGGAWERIIRSVRKVLSFVLQDQNPSDETLLTAFTEVERILNNRPIVPTLSGDPNSLALTPNDLLLMRNNTGLGPHVDIVQRYNSVWNHARTITLSFWKRWTKEYLPTLLTRQKWLTELRNFTEGDVVLVVSEAFTKDQWPLGIIVGCFPDSDGLVRTVNVKTKNGIVKRDIRKLCLLEGTGVGSNYASQSEHERRDVGPPQVGDGSSGLSHPEGPPGTI